MVKLIPDILSTGYASPVSAASFRKKSFDTSGMMIIRPLNFFRRSEVQFSGTAC